MKPTSFYRARSGIRSLPYGPRLREEPFEFLDGNTQGYARDGGVIAVNPTAQLPHKTLFHELGHQVLGHVSEGEQTDGEQLSRNLREAEAEAVALICCEALGLKGADYCRGYIQDWLKGAGIPERSAQRIFSAASKILQAGRDENEPAGSVTRGGPAGRS